MDWARVLWDQGPGSRIWPPAVPKSCLAGPGEDPFIPFAVDSGVSEAP